MAVAGRGGLILPMAPPVAFPYESSVPAGQAPVTTFAKVAGLPAVSVPITAVMAGELPLGIVFRVHMDAGRGRGYNNERSYLSLRRH